MSEPSILAVKPRQLTAGAKKDLRAAGIIVIEVADPSEIRFMRPHAELSSTEMLCAALKAIKQHRGSEYLGREIIEAVLSKQSEARPTPKETAAI